MKYAFHQLTEDTLLIRWQTEVSSELLYRIIGVEQRINQLLSESIIETYPAYDSLAIHYDTEKTSHDHMQQQLDEILKEKKSLKMSFYEWELPICYEEAFGPDLKQLADSKNLEVSEVIQLHTTPTYLVHFIGFLPGFLYLGGLHPALYTPRKSHPDRAISPGAVAIGGTQTGIYPSESPGGWHVIGNCPIPLFDPKKSPPCVFRPGDQVRFSAVTAEAYQAFKRNPILDITPKKSFTWEN